jgi:DNA-binding SARP family transcriptional activator
MTAPRTGADGVLDFRLLGSLQALRDGEPLALGGQQRRALLAVLLANRNRAVPVGDIVDALWGEQPPASATGSIQVAISALRGVLGQAGSSGGPLRTVPGGYQLVVADGACDADRMRSHVRAAHQARGSGELDTAARHYRAALAEWSGRPLQDLSGLLMADQLAVAYEEERLACLEAGLEIDLELGRHRDVVSELAGLVREHPTRERLWALYLLALYRCGRQADALAAFHDLRRSLRDELGVEPSPALARLHEAVLRQDPDLLEQGGHPTTKTLIDATMSISGLLVAPDGNETVVASVVRIGRGDTNQLVVTDPKASRQHAAVSRTAAGYIVTDLTSTNGTRVNGEVIVRPTPLIEGDVIAIGDYQLTFRVRLARN